MRITREEAITEFKAYMESDSYVDAPSNEACLLAVNALRSVHRPEFCNESSDMMDPPNEWVSVEERIPNFGKLVIATDGTTYGVAWLCSDCTWMVTMGYKSQSWFGRKITHWMPIPALPNHRPPEGEEDT